MEMIIEMIKFSKSAGISVGITSIFERPQGSIDWCRES